MKEYYVIVSIHGGYWDDYFKEFRGANYATPYDDELTAKNYAFNAASLVEPCYIIKIYDRT